MWLAEGLLAERESFTPRQCPTCPHVDEAVLRGLHRRRHDHRPTGHRRHSVGERLEGVVADPLRLAVPHDVFGGRRREELLGHEVVAPHTDRAARVRVAGVVVARGTRRVRATVRMTELVGRRARADFAGEADADARATDAVCGRREQAAEARDTAAAAVAAERRRPHERAVVIGVRGCAVGLAELHHRVERVAEAAAVRGDRRRVRIRRAHRDLDLRRRVHAVERLSIRLDLGRRGVRESIAAICAVLDRHDLDLERGAGVSRAQRLGPRGWVA